MQNKTRENKIESIEVALTKPKKVKRNQNDENHESQNNNTNNILNLSTETQILGPAGDEKPKNTSKTKPTTKEFNLLEVYSGEFPISNSRKMIKDGPFFLKIADF